MVVSIHTYNDGTLTVELPRDWSQHQTIKDLLAHVDTAIQHVMQHFGASERRVEQRKTEHERRCYAYRLIRNEPWGLGCIRAAITLDTETWPQVDVHYFPPKGRNEDSLRVHLAQALQDIASTI